MIKKIFSLFILIISYTSLVYAQDQVEIKNAFDKYGKQQGVVYVQLSHDILSQESNLSLYKSMMIKNSTERLESDLMTPLLSKKDKWKIISEVKRNGIVESGSYYVGKDKTDKLNTYLLIKNKNKNITILYIEGSFAPQRLDDELKKLKQLFIYVNNEKVRIY